MFLCNFPLYYSQEPSSDPSDDATTSNSEENIAETPKTNDFDHHLGSDPSIFEPELVEPSVYISNLLTDEDDSNQMGKQAYFIFTNPFDSFLQKYVCLGSKKAKKDPFNYR